MARNGKGLNEMVQEQESLIPRPISEQLAFSRTIHQSKEADIVERLCRLLMMMKNESLSLSLSLKFDLGVTNRL